MISLPDQFFTFIEENLHSDPNTLRLRSAGKHYPFPMDFAITQIEGRRKGTPKLEPFISSPRFLFPSRLSAEQATDYRVAKFHAGLTQGKRVLDLTAGLGIDAMTVAESAESVTAVEIDSEKCECLVYNSDLLGRRAEVKCAEAESFVAECAADSFDVIFIDPARRDSEGKRVYDFSDCSPDVLTMLPDMLKAAPEVLIKASPMLDLTAVVRAIPHIKELFIVSLRGEVKEVLVRVSREADSDALETAYVMIGKEGITEFRTQFGNASEQIQYADTGDLRKGCWLYEPDASVMKGAPWGELCSRFPGLKKVSRDTHLFIGTQRAEGFPGREVLITGLPDKKSSHALKGTTANVTVRNYPLSADALKKKLGIKDGGERFLYAFRDARGKAVTALCERMKDPVP